MPTKFYALHKPSQGYVKCIFTLENPLTICRECDKMRIENNEN